MVANSESKSGETDGDGDITLGQTENLEGVYTEAQSDEWH